SYPGYEDGNFVTIVAPEPDTSVLLDGAPLDVAWSPLPDRGKYMIAPVNTGEHAVSADKPVAVYVFGYREYGSYGYTAGFALSITNLKAGMTINPPESFEGQLAEITVNIRNEGDKKAEDVVVRAFHGGPVNGGVQIGEDVYFDTLYPKETKTVSFTWETYGHTGTNSIYIIADPDDTVKESNEADNTAMASVEVSKALKPDPSVAGPDITLSHQIASEGETVAISATIKNRGAAIGSIPVSLYLGDPAGGGILLEDKLIPQIVPLNGAVTVDFSFSTLGFQDSNSLFIVLDHENIIDELTEINNTAIKELQIARQKLDLGVTTDAVRYYGNSGVGISVLLKNEGTTPVSGTGVVIIEDISGAKIADVATWEVDVKPLGLENWNYRASLTITESQDLNNAIAVAYVNFSSLFSSLGISGNTLDMHSPRVLEFDASRNFLGEKTARFEMDAGFDPATNASGSLFWLMEGATPANTSRYFYLYFDTVENGTKPPPVNTGLPLKGKLIAFSGYVGNLYSIKVNEDGTFGSPASVDQISLSLLNGIGFNDFNNDGYPDIIAGDTLGDICYYENTADGSDTFLPEITIGNINPLYTSNNVLQPVTSADYNNDGNRDFVLNSTQSEVYIFYGNGDGTFSRETISHYPDNRLITGKASADLDNDGYVDIITGDSTGVVSVLFNNGGQGFDAPEVYGEIFDYVSFGIAANIYSLTAGDLTGDGYTDILVSTKSRKTFIMKGRTNGFFEPSEQVTSLVTAGMAAYDVFDINGDGILDVMAVQYSPGEIYYFQGNGDGSFKAPVTIPTNAYYATAIKVSKTRTAPEVIANTGAPEKIESRVYQFTWNSGDTLTGDYSVAAVIYDSEANLVARHSTPISIASTEGIVSNLVFDSISYYPNESAEITSTLTSSSINKIYENIAASITVKDPAGQMVFTEVRTIGILTPSAYFSFKSYWNTGINHSGDYPVTLEVKDTSGNVLSVSTKNIVISSAIEISRLLTGHISVDKQSLLQGEPVGITYSITNVGNIDLSQIDLSILTLHTVDLTTYDTLNDQTPLLMGAAYNNMQELDTGDYSAKDYLVILRADISGVETTLAGTYFRVEGAPSAPSLYIPHHGDDVETPAPELSVNNASDPNDDDLTYEFELYSDSGLSNLLALSGMITESDNTTSWRVPSDLQENSIYYWRARAYDGMLYGEWMSPASFRVNVNNDPPAAPTLSGPTDNLEVDTFTPVLTVNNASDPDSENLTYNFELALDTGFTQIVSGEIGTFEGDGITSWQVPVNLSENTYYYWRGQADDWLVEGQWMTAAGFFVNTANDAPAAPAIITPPDGSEITALSPGITVTNSTDPENDLLAYIFELDTVMTFDSPDLTISGSIPEGIGTTSWHMEGLSDNTHYYVRAKAGDGLVESPWSEVTGFFANTVNDAPSTPVLSNPSDGGGVKVFTPTLSVHNSSDIDGDTLTYEFEIYGDAEMTNILDNVSGIEESFQITSWTVSISLLENHIYYWRARAFDGEFHSDWMPPASFMVNTANDAPAAPLLCSPAGGSSADTLYPALSVYNAADPDSDSLTYKIEIYENNLPVQIVNSVSEDPSGITSVILVDGLSDNTTYAWRVCAYDGDRYG
ncbi:MAG: VCBS repeat-containing protein, partial [Thermodesulfovibrionia bacterium]|nr:VCBS repeat-containing protein [Thermodesulfovibrionia bacterium]